MRAPSEAGLVARRAVVSLLLAVAAAAAPAGAQEPARVQVHVRTEGAPVAGARVAARPAAGMQVAALTDSEGTAILHLVPGRYRVSVTRTGFARANVALAVAGDTALEVRVEPAEEAEAELEALVVTATRSPQRIEDVPVRVEVLGREEVEEKMLMTPGDVAMMLNETSGLRVQSTSPSLGGASVRVQGLRGRYTQVLADGLPLYGGQTGSLGLLQIPPMDLAQVEVIKGAVSALYGASALGGVVNLVSRRPGDDRELLLNQTTLGGSDAVLWQSGRLGDAWGYTLLAGAHRQADADVDGDGWADLPGYRRLVVRPRWFREGGPGTSFFLTAGATLEDREGGGMPTPGVRFAEELETGRADAGLVGRVLLPNGMLLNLRGSAMLQRHRHTFGDAQERDRHTTWFGEGSLAGVEGAHTWVVGAALQQEEYRARDVAGFDYRFILPSLFAQDDWAAAEWLSLSASARADWHSEYGGFVSPRLSALLRPAGGWTVRASAGLGYFAPTPFTEETEAVGLGRVSLAAEGLEAERARTASLDVGRAFGGLELNATLFGSVVSDAVQTRPAPGGGVVVANVPGETRTRGTELLVRWHGGPVHLTATHTFVRASEPEPAGGGRREVPLTPRHQVGVVAMWEEEGAGRIGVELYYTGRQRLEDNPYRGSARPFVVTGFLAERRFGRVRAFLNAENLLDARQTRWDPLVLPSRAGTGRWTTDLWAPAEGRVFNAGVRLEL